MRWDNLFDDLESQLEGGLRADESELLVEEERLRLARLSLRDRLAVLSASGTGAPIRFLLMSGRTIDIAPTTLGRDWVSGALLREGAARGHGIVPFAALQGVMLTREQVAASVGASAGVPGGSLSARLGLGYVLRDLCRRRSAIDVSLVAGGTVHGTVDRVGRDHLDLAIHDAGTVRRESEVSHYRLVPLSAIECVHTSTHG